MILVVVIVVLLLLMAAGGVVFTAVLCICILRARSSRSEVKAREDIDRIYDTIDEREMTTIRPGPTDEVKEDTDSVYETMQEKMPSETKNAAYIHVGKERGGALGSGDRAGV